jgi:hypothetical protein
VELPDDGSVAAAPQLPVRNPNANPVAGQLENNDLAEIDDRPIGLPEGKTSNDEQPPIFKNR